MKIALVGATGTAGRATAHAAQQAGHEVIALSLVPQALICIPEKD